MTSDQSDKPLRITQVTIMHGKSPALLTRSDGKVADYPITPTHRDPNSRIEAISALLDRQELTILTTREDVISIPLPDMDNLAGKAGKPSVYLDQNHWSSLANAQHAPEKLPQEELEAAQKLITLALERRIILPLSAAHMSETAKWGDSDRRYDHAVTLARLSGGWLMRDPLDVRTREILAAMQPTASWTEPVVTRDQRVLFSGRSQTYGPSLLSEEDPPEQVDFMTAQLGTIDALLDEEKVEMGASPGWVEKNQNLAGWIAEAAKSQSKRREVVDRFFLLDTSTEVATAASVAGLTTSDLEEWLTGPAIDDIASMPCLSTFRECLFDKLSDPRNNWESNDLTDIFYLTCAVAYCDFVACERSLHSILVQGAKRLGRDSQVFRKLSDLLPALESALGVDDSENNQA